MPVAYLKLDSWCQSELRESRREIRCGAWKLVNRVMYAHASVVSQSTSKTEGGEAVPCISDGVLTGPRDPNTDAQRGHNHTDGGLIVRTDQDQ